MATILVIDDEPTLRSAIGKALRSDGYTTVEEPNGARALQRLSEHAVELVILDIFMPEVDGVELTARIEKESGLDDQRAGRGAYAHPDTSLRSS